MIPLSDLEHRICRVLDARARELLRDLAAHVAIPTGHNFTPGLDEYRGIVTDRLARLGASVELVSGLPRPAWLTLPNAIEGESAVPPVAIARSRARGLDTTRVLIAGHLDTVHDPRGAFRELSIAPDGQTCVGPGAVDMKGGILIALTALEALAECGVACEWTFLLNSDEETGSFHSHQALLDEARQHDVGIALEPATPDGGLVIERMGSGQFKIEVAGRSAHVGRDFARGVSAVNALAEVILRAAAFNRPDQSVIVNVGPLRGGSVTNAVPDHAACWGNVRFADAARATALQQSFDDLQRAELPSVTVYRAFNRPAKALTPDVQRLATHLREVAQLLGQALPFSKTGGVCDGNILQEAGLATLDTLGVRGGNLHRTDEFVEVRSLVERSQLLAVFLTRLASVSRMKSV